MTPLLSVAGCKRVPRAFRITSARLGRSAATLYHNCTRWHLRSTTPQRVCLPPALRASRARSCLVWARRSTPTVPLRVVLGTHRKCRVGGRRALHCQIRRQVRVLARSRITSLLMAVPLGAPPARPCSIMLSPRARMVDGLGETRGAVVRREHPSSGPSLRRGEGSTQSGAMLPRGPSRHPHGMGWPIRL